MHKTIKNKKRRCGGSAAIRLNGARRSALKTGKPGLHASVRRVCRPAEPNRPSPCSTKENDMQENYLISIKGSQNVDGEVGKVELTTLGSYLKRGASRYIVYKEYASDDTPAERTSILKIDGSKSLTLMRRGGDSTRLILENGKRHLCQYDTGYGNLMIGIFTSRLDSDLTDEGGNLNVSYTLDVNSALSSTNELSITVKEAKNNDVKN